jgi:Flp pilus assembly protein TadG
MKAGMRHSRGLRTFLREQIGQSIIEIALTMPLLVWGLLGAADMGRAYAIQIAVQNGARAGAESYALDATPTVSEAQQHAVDEMNRTPGMSADVSMAAVSVKQSDGTTNCITPPTVALPCFVTVRVQYTFRTATAWPLIPNVFNFDRSTSMRVFK